MVRTLVSGQPNLLCRLQFSSSLSMKLSASVSEQTQAHSLQRKLPLDSSPLIHNPEVIHLPCILNTTARLQCNSWARTVAILGILRVRSTRIVVVVGHGKTVDHRNREEVVTVCDTHLGTLIQSSDVGGKS